MNPKPPLRHSTPLPTLLQALRALYPPQCLVHVGAGHGTGDLAVWRQWPELPRAVVIDADNGRLTWARQTPSWQVLHTTVAASAAPHTYFRASNPQEDGLVPPEQLKAWWPQLTTLGTDTRHTQTLDEIIPAEATRADSCPGHWLLLDCLPAALLLRGASELLARTSVVCARTSQLATQAEAANAALADTGHQAVIDLLEPQGFVLLGQTETHHPALGYTVMARQPAALLAHAQPQSHSQAAEQASAPVPAEMPTPSTPASTELQADNDALRQRLALLQEELLRAEGQINLIKDLMLRDQEL